VQGDRISFTYWSREFQYRQREKQKMSAYGTAVTIKGTTYYYIIDTKAQVRELLLGCTAPVEKVVVQEETRGLPHRELSAQEILDIVLNHPVAQKEEEVLETLTFSTTAA
jgi:hypothetical protein